jgi:quercetin dioxygenase-like cupin family protein
MMNDKSHDRSGPKAPASALRAATPSRLADLVSYGDGAVVSRTLSKGSSGTMTVFAFDRGEALSEHSAPFDAYVTVLEGVMELKVGGQPVIGRAGEIILLPANVPHGLTAVERAKMLLVMFKQPAPEPRATGA